MDADHPDYYFAMQPYPPFINTIYSRSQPSPYMQPNPRRSSKDSIPELYLHHLQAPPKGGFEASFQPISTQPHHLHLHPNVRPWIFHLHGCVIDASLTFALQQTLRPPASLRTFAARFTDDILRHSRGAGKTRARVAEYDGTGALSVEDQEGARPGCGELGGMGFNS